MSKRPKVDPEEVRAPLSPGEIATAAYGLVLLQAHDDKADVYEALALLSLEALATLANRDPAAFDLLLRGLGEYAKMRSAECLRSAIAGIPPPPLGAAFGPPVSVH